MTRIGILHGAGFVGRELISLVDGHPDMHLGRVTSRTFAGRPVWHAHASLRGQSEISFSKDAELGDMDAVFVAAEHGQSVHAVGSLLDAGFPGPIVDLSADFRFHDASLYETYFGYVHPRPELLPEVWYGAADIVGAPPEGTHLVANPGCFATGMMLALHPLRHILRGSHVAVTAMTGASGSGVRPSAGTHYPNRDGNVRAYRVLAHQHVPEVSSMIGEGVDVAFVPASGPWTRGIWGTAQVSLVGSGRAPHAGQFTNEVAGGVVEQIEAAYHDAYATSPLVRLWPGQIPELGPVVGTPFGDIGWVIEGSHLVVGFAIDNLLKGAASQAVQNMNLLLGLPEEVGLTGTHSEAEVHL